jgi:S-adenosylmethionine:tRNA ribosyltransferase-isomerase
MLIEDLCYKLRPENIVGTPREIRLGRRDRGRMMVVDRNGGSATDHVVADLPLMLEPGDVVVLNNSKRIPGVLHGRTAKGGKVELRFVDVNVDGTGLCRVFPMHDTAPRSVVTLNDGGEIEIAEFGITKYGLARVRPLAGSLRQMLVDQGTPILGFFYDGMWNTEHLNPFYATEEGTVESPLAGLHFTPELVDRLKSARVKVCFVTLHSVGSWLPFIEEKIEDHEMMEEFFRVPIETASTINAARDRGKRVVACGSTSLRALESAVDSGGVLKAKEGKTGLYISPSYKFGVVDGYFTNFHQYQTSLLVLDCAFAGTENVMQAYREASRRGYEFYEFGDAIFYR